MTAISNTRRGSGEGREEQATAIEWTLWGTLAIYASEYLAKGSHVNIVGRLRNNRYEKDGETVYGMTSTADEIDYLDSRVDSEARRARDGANAPAEEEPAKAKPPASPADQARHQARTRT